jgi:uncharacterized phage-associated protein
MEKLKNLILHLSRRCEHDEYFGATKLNKLLFLIDFNSYALQKRPATEATYVHLQHGPVPAQLVAARRELIEEGSAVLEERELFSGHRQHRLKAIAGADMSLFNHDELRIIEVVVKKHAHLSGTGISDATHDFLPWKCTLNGEEIPYQTAFVMRDEPVTLGDKIWALQELDRLGLV